MAEIKWPYCQWVQPEMEQSLSSLQEYLRTDYQIPAWFSRPGRRITKDDLMASSMGIMFWQMKQDPMAAQWAHEEHRPVVDWDDDLVDAALYACFEGATDDVDEVDLWSRDTKPPAFNKKAALKPKWRGVKAQIGRLRDGITCKCPDSAPGDTVYVMGRFNDVKSPMPALEYRCARGKHAIKDEHVYEISRDEATEANIKVIKAHDEAVRAHVLNYNSKFIVWWMRATLYERDHSDDNEYLQGIAPNVRPCQDLATFRAQVINGISMTKYSIDLGFGPGPKDCHWAVLAGHTSYFHSAYCKGMIPSRFNLNFA
ncbi:hypothetical protein HII31_12208 [Pseudocercospora fuligena]|uniref:Uncharacterized protein n=1 Tax=Pseudocercospora fuligena TaxID=685502 RepID=A0A8H6R8G5_9PEZI|nr:hypothetical protein HII31_12208 [Pseudocercospora fuligena]